jgi:hypothetical protein
MREEINVRYRLNKMNSKVEYTRESEFIAVNNAKNGFKA